MQHFLFVCRGSAFFLCYLSEYEYMISSRYKRHLFSKFFFSSSSNPIKYSIFSGFFFFFNSIRYFRTEASIEEKKGFIFFLMNVPSGKHYSSFCAFNQTATTKKDRRIFQTSKRRLTNYREHVQCSRAQERPRILLVFNLKQKTKIVRNQSYPNRSHSQQTREVQLLCYECLFISISFNWFFCFVFFFCLSFDSF